MNDQKNRFDNNQNRESGNREGNQQGGKRPKKQNLLVFLIAT